jgi:hypothetical protein
VGAKIVPDSNDVTLSNNSALETAETSVDNSGDEVSARTSASFFFPPDGAD